MDRLTIEEELPYLKKTWKGFTSTFQSKVLGRLRKPKGFIKTTQHLLSKNRCHHHHHHHVYFHHHHHVYGSGELLQDQPVSVNDRYVHKEIPEAAKSTAPVTAPLPQRQQQRPAGIEKIEGHIDDDWQDVNGSHDYDDDDNLADDEDENDDYGTLVGTPEYSETLILHGVNAESEKFIRNFYERLKLERQRSIEEFDELLDHSSY
jgi:hypothetical protein